MGLTGSPMYPTTTYVVYTNEGTPYVQEIKKLRVLIINKDERKSLARKNGNENPIWIWNDSPE